MSTTTWRFAALDTWFFRESRPHESIGGSELGSLFPPPARTVAGAIRTLIGDRAGVDWAAFAKNGNVHKLEGLDVAEEIGRGDDLGKLQLSGPWMVWENPAGKTERLYPAPAFLMARKEGKHTEILRLCVDTARQCDLGRIYLPVLSHPDAKPLERAWLSAENLALVLAGQVLKPEQLVDTKDLYEEESRLGIARNNEARAITRGLLYQTRHIRPQPGMIIEMDVDGVDPRLYPSTGRVRLGGEGRLASVSILQGSNKLPKAPTPGPETRGLILCLLTHADLGDEQKGGWLLPGFREEERKGCTVWCGKIKEVRLTLLSAVLGKPVREGGWDLLKNCPRPVRSLLPAGSAWYCIVEGNSPDLTAAIDALHGTRIGHDTKLGRGQLAVGLWNESEYPKENTP